MDVKFKSDLKAQIAQIRYRYKFIWLLGVRIMLLLKSNFIGDVGAKEEELLFS